MSILENLMYYGGCALFLVSTMWIINAQSGQALVDGSCNHFSNATHDPVAPLPFTDKCLGIKNYWDEKDHQVKRGFKID